MNLYSNLYHIVGFILYILCLQNTRARANARHCYRSQMCYHRATTLIQRLKISKIFMAHLDLLDLLCRLLQGFVLHDPCFVLYECCVQRLWLLATRLPGLEALGSGPECWRHRRRIGGQNPCRASCFASAFLKQMVEFNCPTSRASCFASVFLKQMIEFNHLFQKDRGKTASAARILFPNPTRRPSPCLLNESFFYAIE